MSFMLVIAALTGIVVGVLHFLGREIFRRKKQIKQNRSHCTCPTCGRALSPLYPSFCFACGEVLPNDYDPYAGLAERVESSVILSGVNLRISIHQGREYGRPCFFASIHRWPETPPRQSATTFQVFQDETMREWDSTTFAEWLVELSANLYVENPCTLRSEEDFDSFLQALEETVSNIEQPPRRFSIRLDMDGTNHYLTLQEEQRTTIFWKDDSTFTLSVRRESRKKPHVSFALSGHDLGPRTPHDVAHAVQEFLNVSHLRQPFLNVPDDDYFSYTLDLLKQMDSVASITRSCRIVEESLTAYDQLERLEDLGESVLGDADHLHLIKQGRDDLAFLIVVADAIDKYPTERVQQYLFHFEELMDALDPQGLLRLPKETDHPRGLLSETLATLQCITKHLSAIIHDPQVAWIEFGDEENTSHAVPPSLS